MRQGRVLGHDTATIRHPSMKGWKLLVVQELDPDGELIDGDPMLAVDAHGAHPALSANERNRKR